MIAIIAILAAIVIVAINPARQLAQARNAQRASDINAIYKAVQQYYLDELDWPDGDLDGSLQEICDTGGDTEIPNCLDLSAELVPTYLSALPINPGGENYEIALQTSNKLALIAPGSTEEGLGGVAIGTSTSLLGGGEDVPCSEQEGDARRYCDLEDINDAIVAYIAANEHAPYLDCGDITEPDKFCQACETEGCVDWDTLAAELAEYIDPLPTDPCGDACYVEEPRTFYTYAYVAPSCLAFWYSENPEACSEEEGCYSNEAYGLHADTWDDEGESISYGFGSF